MSEPNQDGTFAGGLEPAEQSPQDATEAPEFAPGLEPEDPAKSRASLLDTSARLASTRDPAQHAKIVQMSDYTGLDRALVERNPDEVKSVVAHRQIDADSVGAHSPALAEWLSNFDNMAVARDDIKGLQRLESWAGRWAFSAGLPLPGVGFAPPIEIEEGFVSRAIKVGMQQREQSMIGWDALLSGGDPDANPRVAEIDAFLAEDYGKEAGGVGRKAALSSLEMVAPMGASIATGFAVGRAAGAVASAAGPLSPLAVPTAVSAGTSVGMGYETMKQEAGAAYIEILRDAKTRGVTVDRRTAAGAAAVAGVANAAVEVLGSKVTVAMLPFLGPLFGQAAQTNIGGVTLKKAITKSVAGYFGAILGESATESIQRLGTVAAKETAIGLSGGETDFASIPGEMGREFVGALWATPGLLLPGATGQLASHLHGIRSGKVTEARAKAFGDISKDINLAKTAPEMLADFAAKAQATNGGSDTVHISADAWTQLFQGQGVDPASAAAQMGVGEEYLKAKETGDFIKMPFGTYASRIAPNPEYNTALAKDVKFDQEGMTGREAVESEKSLKALTTSMGAETEKASTAKSAIYQDRFNQLRSLRSPDGSAKISETDADHYARLHEAYFKTQAQRTGLTTEELASVFPLSIQAGEAVPGPDVTLNQPAGYEFTPAGEMQRKDKPALRYFIVNRDMPDGTGKAGSRVSEEVIRRNGLDPDAREAQRQGDPRTRALALKESINQQLEAIDEAAGVAYRKESKRGLLPGETESDRNERLGSALQNARAGSERLTNARAWVEMVISQSHNEELVKRFESWANEGFPERRMEDGGVRPDGLPERRGVHPDGFTLFQSERRATPRSIPLSELNPEQQRIEDTYRKVRSEGGRLDPSLVKTVVDMARSNAPASEIEAAITAAGGKPADYGPLYDKTVPLGQRYGQDARGSITFSRAGSQGEARGKIDKFLSRFGITPREFTISLSQTADLSTFLHETGHYFLETFADLAYSDKATDQTRDDFEKLLDYFGVKTRDDIGTEHHEKFARAFEAYLQDGKAPSLALVRPFARFSAWLKSLYRSIVGHGGILTPEVRGVMDRMIATDDQIQAVTQSAAYIPMFRNAAEAGMTEEKFADYNAKAETAFAEAQAILNARIATEQRRETEAWWKEERAKVQKEVAARVNAERPVQAYRYFAGGAIPDGADAQVFADENGKPYKMSLAEIDAAHPGLSQTIRKELGRTGLSAKGSIDTNSAAALFGYSNGSEFLQALTTMDPPDRRIARETQATMIAKHGDILHDGTLPQAAEEAARDSTARLSQLLQELDALNRKAGMPRVKLTQVDLEKAAFSSIREGKVRDVDPSGYRQAERTAATNAIKAAKAGKYDEAVEWQRRRLLNFALSREAAKAQKEAAAAAKFLANSDKPATRSRLGLAGHTYQEQQDELLTRFDFRKRSNTDIDRSQSLADWVMEQREQQFDPEIPKKLLNEAFKTNWKNMSVNDLLALRDAVRNIQHQAKRKNQLIVAGKTRSFDAAILEGLSSLRANVADPGIPSISETNSSAIAKVMEQLDRFDKFNVKIEE